MHKRRPLQFLRESKNSSLYMAAQKKPDLRIIYFYAFNSNQLDGFHRISVHRGVYFLNLQSHLFFSSISRVEPAELSYIPHGNL